MVEKFLFNAIHENEKINTNNRFNAVLGKFSSSHACSSGERQRREESTLHQTRICQNGKARGQIRPTNKNHKTIIRK